RVIAEPRQLLPCVATVGRAEERRVLDAGEHRVRIGQRRLEMPHPRELPGMLRPVVPLVRARNALVRELVADRLPGLAAVVRALDDGGKTWEPVGNELDRKSTRLNSSHRTISYAVFCLKKKNIQAIP